MMFKLENVAVAMHCNLRPVVNYDAHAKIQVNQPMSCRLTASLLLIHCNMLWSWPSTLSICGIPAVPWS